MNLLDATAQVEALLRSGPLDTCTIVDVFLGNETLHYSDMFHAITIDDGSGDGIGEATYRPMGDRLIPPDETQETQALGSNSIDLFLDSSRISDGSDAVGQLVDNDIVQRRIRLRTVLFQPETSRTIPLWIFDVRDGVIDGADDTIQVGEVSALGIRIASGAFAYNERRKFTYSPADQAELHPGDTGFTKMAQLSDTVLKWTS